MVCVKTHVIRQEGVLQVENSPVSGKTSSTFIPLYRWSVSYMLEEVTTCCAWRRKGRGEKGLYYRLCYRLKEVTSFRTGFSIAGQV